ncbi:hypothetical protein E1B28_002811 [Marasmius oreades]|uniref:Uncharacterized protein n=1 Tax=Marasmius oreades TaxID=181124 RepID=A0A9P7RNI0_9AGAR|nr:uncharacterized protein E1B28_002811 [Marasmius oreades]KAG7086891.1 hypothetical protein E1B28_002811 [Marasmius oreades]
MPNLPHPPHSTTSKTLGHHYCVACDKLFNSAGGPVAFFYLKRAAPPSRIHDDEDDEDDHEKREDNWEDELALQGCGGGCQDPDIYPEDTSFEDEEDLGDPPYDFVADSKDGWLEEGVKEPDEFKCSMC